MRTPSLYVRIGVELFSSCNWLTSSYLHNYICYNIYSINTLLKTEVLKYASKKGRRK